MVGRPLPRRAAPAVLTLFCAGFLTTCDFLTSDIFPSWLSYAEARFDLETAAVDFVTASNPLNGIDVEYIRTLSGEDLIVVLFMGNTNRRLLILDPGDLETLATLNDAANFTPFLGAASDGNLACGTRSIDPVTYATSPGANIGVSGSRQWVLRTGAGSDQYLIGFDNGLFNVQRHKYNFDWTNYIGVTSGTTWAAPYPLSPWYLVDCETDTLGTGANFLFAYYGGPNQIGFASYFNATAAIEANPRDFLNAASDLTGPFPMDEGRAWLTSGGPVAFVRGDKGTDRLVRYKFGTGNVSTGTESTILDSIPIDDDDELTVLSFDPSGTWWFAYDRRTGFLYKLRTWWK